MKKDDFNAARLLAGQDEPSVLEKEELLDEILNKRAKTSVPNRGFKWLMSWRLAFAGLAAAPLVIWIAWSTIPQDEFRARGEADLPPQFSMSCDGDCRIKSKIYFQFESVAGYSYFSALVHGGEDQTIWYFPTEKVPSFKLSESPIAIELAEHRVGEYSLYAIFSHRPLSQSEIRAHLREEHLLKEVEVNTRVFEVKP